MRHFKGAVYGLLFSAVVCLAAFFVKLQVLKRWHSGKIGSETAHSWKNFADLFLGHWYIIVLVSAGIGVLFFHIFKKEKEEGK